MSSPGWYVDPGGQPGRYRYWDGRQWSAQLSDDPSAPPPGSGTPAGAAGAGTPGAAAGTAGPGTSGPGRPGSTVGGNPPGGPSSGRGGVGWWLAGGGLVIALIIGAVIVVPQLLTGRSVLDPDPTDGPTPESLCPPYPSDFPTEAPVATDGRVHAGNMSYPELGAPWSAPIYDNRVPFGRDTATQVIITETRDDESVWQAGVLIAELAAGDGFFSPEQGSEIVTECIVGSFYGNAEVTRDDQRNEAITIDGHEAWIVESQLGFDIPDIEAKSELMIVVIVRTTDVTSALYFASIPENVPEYEQPARDLVDELRVED